MMRALLAGLLFLLIPAMAGADDDIRPFDAAADAGADVDAALARAAERGGRVILVLGGNWCHDSRGFAGHMASAEMQPVLESYEVVWVDVGMRDRNQDIPARFGVPVIYATPTILVVDPEFGLVNRASVHDWGNAHSRPTSDAVEYFTTFATVGPGLTGIVENTAAYQGLVAQIDAWEAREGARLMRAYREVEAMRGEDDEDFRDIENRVERQRRRMRNDVERLRGDARDEARAALIAFADGRSLDAETAAAWDASEPALALDLPDYEPLGPWEAEAGE